jgi:two-component system chemotaxis sensor kinase CheA
MRIFTRFRATNKTVKAKLGPANLATQGKTSIVKIISLVGIAIVMFLIFFIYGLTSSIKIDQQLSSIKTLYFPVLEQIDATIVNIDRIEGFLVQAVMTGEVEELTKAREVFSRTLNILTQVRTLYPAQDEELKLLHYQFENYFTFADETTQTLLANAGNDALNQSVQMNQLLLKLRQHIGIFRASSYQNFLSTVDETHQTTTLNFYMSIGVGVINLMFITILVFFIHLLNKNNHAISNALEQTATLLNNSKQGFFTFGADMNVLGTYSQACVALLGTIPTGHNADDLLFPYSQNNAKRKLMRTCIEDALQAKTSLLATMYLELIPTELRIDGKVLIAQYIPIQHGIMVVLSDISEQIDANKKTQEEKNSNAMILAAITDGPDFIATVNEFIAFCKAGSEPWLRQEIADLYRAIHTFKGSLNQFHLTHVPAALHGIESFLNDLPFIHDLLGEEPSHEVTNTVFGGDWLDLLNKDLERVRAALGDDFFTRGGIIPLHLEEALLFEQLANQLLRTRYVELAHEPVLKTLADLCSTSLHTELAALNKLVQQVAGKLDKEVLPLEITGEDLRLDPKIYRQFFLSLGHVIRNAIDHGIEDPDTRYAKGKPDAGTIRCTSKNLINKFKLIIEDDGAGINEAALRLRAFNPLITDYVSPTLAELVFADGLSSRTTVSQTSGRGVGMAAVRAEVLRLGGTVNLTTDPDHGTQFIFHIPILKNTTV